MDIPDILELLSDFDSSAHYHRAQAKLLQYRGGGGSQAWDCQTSDGSWYIMKCQNNPQESGAQRRPDQPLKIVTSELVCGRLGQLFSPPVCPETVIIEVPASLAAATLYPNNLGPISAGPNVGSRRVESVFDSKCDGAAMSATAQVVPPELMARVVVFQTWLNGQDPAALVALDGSSALSIDHGWYFTGSGWGDDATLSAAMTPELQPVTAQWPRDRLQDATLYRAVLDELMSLPEEVIIQQFAGIPAEWGASPTFMAKLVDCVLKRRHYVERAVATLYKGAA